MLEGLQFLLKTMQGLLSNFRFELGISLVLYCFAAGLKVHPEGLVSSSGPFIAVCLRLSYSLKTEVKTPQMSAGSQAHQDVGSLAACPPYLCQGPHCPGA